MVLPNQALGMGGLDHLPIPGGDKSGSKFLIGAVMAAGENGCQCKSCVLLKKFGSVLADALIKDEGDSGH
jgi:hypothetical protein